MVETDNPTDGSYDATEFTESAKHRSTLKTRTNTEPHKNGEIKHATSGTTEKVNLPLETCSIKMRI